MNFHLSYNSLETESLTCRVVLHTFWGKTTNNREKFYQFETTFDFKTIININNNVLPTNQ